MKGMTAFTCMSDLDLDLIEESMTLFASPKEKRPGRVPSALSRFLNSGWGVAAICGLVSVAVLSAIIWAGNRSPVTPPTPATDLTSEEVTEPLEDTFSESDGGQDTADNGTTESDTETGTEGVFHPDVTQDGVLFISNGDGTCRIKGADKSWQGEITVPEVSPYGDTVTTVAKAAFQGFAGVTSVTLPDTVTVIQNNAFQSCGALVSIDLPPFVTEFGRAVFDGCGELRSVTLPKGLTKIDMMTFQTCVNLQEVVAQEGVTRIEANAFNGCASLSSLTLPAGLEYVGASAFKNCCGLRTVYYGGSRTEWEAVEVNSADNERLEGASVVFD